MDQLPGILTLHVAGTILVLVLAMLLSFDLIIKLLAKRWPTVEGIIRSSAVERRRRGAARHFYQTVVTFSYLVDGVEYSKRFVAAETKFHRNSDDQREAAERQAKTFVPGTPITVYYAPRFPSFGTTRPGFDSKAATLIGLILFACLAHSVWIAASKPEARFWE